jgi:hypothetical protein
MVIIISIYPFFYFSLGFDSDNFPGHQNAPSRTGGIDDLPAGGVGDRLEYISSHGKGNLLVAI